MNSLIYLCDGLFITVQPLVHLIQIVCKGFERLSGRVLKLCQCLWSDVWVWEEVNTSPKSLEIGVLAY